VEAYLATTADLVDENTVVALTEAPALEAGNKIFQANCAACHAADGGGTVGPNLTDVYWKHGGSVNDIFKTIKYGVLDKGMISWKDALSPLQMQQVTSYILSLQGTTPASPKAPEGEEYKPAAAASTPASDTTAAAPAQP
jgi:cytochrome c oxidase cbb3-type subunit 3